MVNLQLIKEVFQNSAIYEVLTMLLYLLHVGLLKGISKNLILNLIPCSCASASFT